MLSTRLVDNTDLSLVLRQTSQPLFRDFKMDAVIVKMYIIMLVSQRELYFCIIYLCRTMFNIGLTYIKLSCDLHTLLLGSNPW